MPEKINKKDSASLSQLVKSLFKRFLQPSETYRITYYKKQKHTKNPGRTHQDYFSPDFWINNRN